MIFNNFIKVLHSIVRKDKNIKDCYIGSTRSYSRRKSQHFTANRFPERPAYNYKIYKCIRENGGEDNWEMEKLFTFKPNDVIHLREIEKDYIINYNANLNTQVPNRSAEQYRIDKYEKLHTTITCSCGGKYTPPHLAVHSQSQKHIKWKESLDK